MKKNQLKANLIAPMAKIIAKTLEKFDDIRVDDYYWLNDKENPEVIDYLNAENDYYQQSTAHLKSFQNTLFDEMKARIKEDDASVPYFYNDYFYYTRFEKGMDYPIHCRKKDSLENNEEIMFDCNQMAIGFSYFNLTGINISEDNIWAAFGIDTVSRRQYTIQIKNLVTGEILTTNIENTTGGSTWASDNTTLFYSRKDEITLRPDKIFKHILHSDAQDDTLIFFEKDETFDVSIYKSKSKKFLIITSSSTLTSEYRTLLSSNPNGKFKVFQKRTRGLEYSISHYLDSFYVLTNKDKATNFKLMRCFESQTGKENWTEFVTHRDNVLLEGIDIFKNYLVISERFKIGRASCRERV